MSSQNVKSLTSDLQKLRNPTKASDLQRFFQTGPGGYGEGDRFLGIAVPTVRSVARKYPTLELSEIEELLKSEFHEIRFCGLVILTEQYKKTRELPLKRRYLNSMSIK